MTADARTTEIANTLAKLAELMAEQNTETNPGTQDHPSDESPSRVLFTVEETARALNVGRTTAYALVRSGEIESVHIGRLRRVPKTAIDNYTERLTSDPSNNQRAA